ncbi:MAG: SPOR domain-containing protein [Gammaproteobacteria bacterium]|nr:SPOR domain-containing protein [Gammaproteobacteria bacterium]
MPRDYAKSSKKKQREPIPGWAWMGGGLTIGLFVAALVYLNEHTPKKDQQLLTNAVKRTIKDARKTQDEKQTGSGEQKRPRFDFYTILPELEVAIPDQDLVSQRKKITAPDKPADKKGSSPQQVASFTLQAGSFRQREQADSLKARLALQGIMADIQTVSINDGDTWHRVRIGPSSDLNALNRTRKQLSAIGVATIVVRNKN